MSRIYANSNAVFYETLEKIGRNASKKFPRWFFTVSSAVPSGVRDTVRAVTMAQFAPSEQLNLAVLPHPFPHVHFFQLHFATDFLLNVFRGIIIGSFWPLFIMPH